jgi:transcriptional antiterminator RfaH
MHWFIAYTKCKQEHIAEENLLRQGYDVLCPQIRVQKLRNRRWTWAQEPLFPRYLFVGAAEGLSWAPVRSTVGVASLVRFGGQVAAVPETLVDTLRASAAEPQHHRPMYQQGQKVRIVAGSFATLEGVFDMADGAERATVLLDLLGRQSRVRVAVGEIVNAD